MRLTKFNPETNEYEYKERAKTQEEFNSQRKAVIQRLGELEDKASDVAEEIFAEIEQVMSSLDRRYMESGNPKQSWGVRGAMTKIAELKKKYIGKDTNVTTKESEDTE